MAQKFLSFRWCSWFQEWQTKTPTAGPDVEDFFYTLAETGADHKTAADKLDGNFASRKKTSYNRHLFRKEKQKGDETAAQFVIGLHQFAALCDFLVDNIDSFIRGQLIDNLFDKEC